MYSLFDASVGTEELNHIEMVCTIVHQLTRNLTVQQIKEQGFADYYVDHTTGIYPVAASGTPWSADTMQSTGDPITDLMENMAAEQKARTTYDNILRLVKDDPDVYDAIKFLRAREIVHFQRFGESLRIVQDNLNSKNFYAFNPAFDKASHSPACLLPYCFLLINCISYRKTSAISFSSDYLHSLFTTCSQISSIIKPSKTTTDF